MAAYLFSIFVRSSVALSGFLVFVVSSRLFGAEGRGVISYGTSIFASLGLIVSFNLGRGFIQFTEKSSELKKKTLFYFLLMNFGLTILTGVLGWAYWFFTDSAQKILELKILFPLILTSVVYVWSVNGNSLFAAFQATKRQEKLILFTRGLLMLVLGYFWVAKNSSFRDFLVVYTLILGVGVVAEWVMLLPHLEVPKNWLKFSGWQDLLRGSFWPHLDFLSFHLFPLLLILICGQFLPTANIGRVNFSIQIVNLIFLLSSTANIRLHAYISNFGYQVKVAQIKKLFFATSLVSVLVGLAIFPALFFLNSIPSFSSFNGAQSLYAVAVLAVPGYLTYHFFSPLWLESGLMRQSALLNLGCTIIFCMATPLLLKSFGETGAVASFALFHTGCLLNQLLMYLKYHKKALGLSIKGEDYERELQQSNPANSEV